MSEPENFLSRWSRRKQEAERPVEKPGDAPDVVPDPEIGEDTPAGVEVEATPAARQEPEFDLSTLPPIESIGVGTDIRSFLQKGVPLDLTRAALRRAWSTDPAIRDFIGIAENQWDFATGSDIPGFGPLEPSEDLRRMVAEVFQERLELPVDKPAMANSDSRPQVARQDASATANTERAPQESASSDTEGAKLLPQTSASENLPRHDEVVAVQQDSTDSSDARPIKRTHGRALPQ